MRNCWKILAAMGGVAIACGAYAQQQLDTKDEIVEIKVSHDPEPVASDVIVAPAGKGAATVKKNSSKKGSAPANRAGGRFGRQTAQEILRGSNLSSRSGGAIRAPFILMNSTAYDESVGQVTKMGTRVGPGTVAVDPRVIPLGTRLYIEGYGEALACDTGSAIKGNIIDVWFRTRAEAMRWGRRKVKVYILGPR